MTAETWVRGKSEWLGGPDRGKNESLLLQNGGLVGDGLVIKGDYKNKPDCRHHNQS